MIELDGSYGEGGGQILRTALGLSILTLKPFKIANIRKNRPNPGLKPQQLACVKACAEFSNAKIKGAEIGSEFLEFYPEKIKNRQMIANIGTAGSTTLLLQSILIPMMFTESEIKITGGTDVKWSMPIDYVKTAIKEMVNPFTSIDIACEKRGYYPIGGGIITVKTKPKYKIIDFDSFEKFHQYIFGNPAIDLAKTGKLASIKGISHASIDLQDKKVAERQSKPIEIQLSGKYPVNIEREYANTLSTGSGILVYAIYTFPGKEKQYIISSDMLGDKGIKSEEVGRVATENLMKSIKQNIVVDEHIQDNIIPLLGLFGGRIKTGNITNHTKSNIYVCEKFLNVEYEIEYQENKNQKDYSNANFISVLSSKRP